MCYIPDFNLCKFQIPVFNPTRLSLLSFRSDKLVLHRAILVCKCCICYWVFIVGLIQAFSYNPVLFPRLQGPLKVIRIVQDCIL